MSDLIDFDPHFTAGDYGRVKIHTTPKPAEADPREKALKAPIFQPAPDLKSPEWITGDVRSTGEAIAAEWSELVSDREALAGKLADRLTTDPMKLTCTKPGARMKEEYALLLREVALREKTDSHLLDLIAESRPEESKRADQVLAVRQKTIESLNTAIHELEIPESLLADRIHRMVAVSGPVQRAMAHCQELDRFISRWKGMNQKMPIQKCRERMQAIAAELIGMC